MKNSTKVKKTGRSIVIRAKVSAIAVTLLLVLLVSRLANLQLVDANDYKNEALAQYTHEVKIEAKRGTIYDRNLKPLAVSATVYNVFVSPNDVENDTQKQLIANGLSEILGVNKTEILEKLSKTKSQYQTIKKMIEDSEEILVRNFITENKLTGIVNLEETTKRYYPYNTLASQLIGFTGTDNTGLYGIEYTYNEYLSGTDGRAVKAQDAAGDDLPYKYANYIKAENGLNLVTTIDYTVQSILEKYVKQAYVEDNPAGAVTGIVMDVNTGEILASALYPNFDLNNRNTLNEYYEAKLLTYQGEDIEAYKYKLLQQMWDNTVTSQTYDPGSTFKMVTSAIALEEGVVKVDDTFFCPGYIKVEGYGKPIKCHKTSGHGSQSFVLALQNSCNPAFVTIGLKIGTSLFIKYFDAFGYTKLSGTDIAGEAGTIYFETTGEKFNTVSLATYSFGQNFSVTPIQHLRALSAVANGGYLVVPHIAKALVDENGNTVQTFEYDNDRQVISQATSDIINTALIDSCQNACVSGYHVITKTGTSENKSTAKDNDYISSCVTFAPAEDPQVAIIITIADPTGNNPSAAYYGSAIAAPVVSKVLGEVLPYLGIEPTSYDSKTFKVENYVGSDATQAKTVLEGKGIVCVTKGTGNIVTSQIPAAGSTISDKGVVVLYTDDTEPELIKVPDVTTNAMSPNDATRVLINNNLNISLTGIFEGNYVCTSVSQSPAAGEMVPPGTIIEVGFRYNQSGLD